MHQVVLKNINYQITDDPQLFLIPLIMPRAMYENMCNHYSNELYYSFLGERLGVVGSSVDFLFSPICLE